MEEENEEKDIHRSVRRTLYHCSLEDYRWHIIDCAKSWGTKETMSHHNNLKPHISKEHHSKIEKSNNLDGEPQSERQEVFHELDSIESSESESDIP